jgi:hypothetical protein
VVGVVVTLRGLRAERRIKDAASPEEVVAELREIDAWNRAHGYVPARIDPGFDPAMKVAFVALGLEEMLL